MVSLHKACIVLSSLGFFKKIFDLFNLINDRAKNSENKKLNTCILIYTKFVQSDSHEESHE